MLYRSNFLNLVGSLKTLISVVRITGRYFITAGVADLVRLRDLLIEILYALFFSTSLLIFQ